MNQGDLLVNRYRLSRRLGKGAMGQVWLAEDTLLHRLVAIKHLVGGDSDDLDDELVQRAMREARLAASLNHPNIVQIYDLFMDDGLPFVVMEYVDGPTLAKQIKDNGPYSPNDAGRIVSQVASGLALAHQAGVIHRDIKPANILLTANGTAKLADFGIARGSNSGETSLTGTGLVIGTLAFMAPEVANGTGASAASDVWSLGATLYTMVEGRSPFHGENSAKLLLRLVTESPAPPAHAGFLTPLVERMLAVDPAARPTAPFVSAWIANPGSVPLAQHGDGPTTTRVVHPAPAPEPTTVRRGAADVTQRRSADSPVPHPQQFAGQTAAYVPARAPRKPSALLVAAVAVVVLIVVAGAVTVTLALRRSDSSASASGRTPSTDPQNSAPTSGASASDGAAGQPTGSGSPSNGSSPAATVVAADIPSVPSRNDPAASSAGPPAPVSPDIVSWTDSGSTPTTRSELVESTPAGLPADQTAAINAMIAFYLDINTQQYSSALRHTTSAATQYNLDNYPSSYATTRFYQLAFGVPRTLSSTEMLVPVRFVYRHDPPAGDKNLPACTYWHEYVILAVKLGGVWRKDEGPYQSRKSVLSTLQPYLRQATSGNYYLNPDVSHRTC